MEHHTLVNELARRTRYTRREVNNMLKALAEVVRESLGSGLDVAIDGIGRFKNVPASARTGRHALTGTRIHIPPGRRVKYSPSRRLKLAVLNSLGRFKDQPPQELYGLRQGEADGKVRSSDRPEEGGEGEAGG